MTPELRDEWMELRGGKPLMVAYGMSEVLAFVVAADWDSGVDLPMVGPWTITLRSVG